MAVTHSNHIGPRVVGQVPFLYSLTFKKIFSLPNHTISVLVAGKRINRGAGYGLEIPVEYVFNGNERALQWAKKTLDNIDANVNKKLGRRLKYKFKYFISNLWFLFCLSSLSASRR